MTTNPYDTVLYSGHALSQAHPDRLATIATLFGMKPAPIENCRVLELGCGDGLNLTALAIELPNAECVGIDLAAAGIQQGRNLIAELGVKNLRLDCLDIMAMSRELGDFDFIIAHGVYSWVPPAVRDRLLGLCRQNLKPNGVAYVSYSTYPGGHFRDMVREMMLYHVSEFADPQLKVAQARQLIKFIAQSTKATAPFREVLQTELERIEKFRDSWLFHDDLADHNTPVYFHEFIDHARRNGLKYLAEAQFAEMQAGIYSAEIVEVLKRMSEGRVAYEQYLDFLNGRRFRQTLLCREEQELGETPDPERLYTLFVASPLRPSDGDPPIHGHQRVEFQGPQNSSISTDNRVIKSALQRLQQVWPRTIPFRQLIGAAIEDAQIDRALQGDAIGQQSVALADMLLRGYAAGIVELHAAAQGFVTEPGGRPVASPLARLQCRSGTEVINLRHQNIPAGDDLNRYLLQQLDGLRDRNELLRGLVALVESGDLELASQGDGGAQLADPSTILADELERRLGGFAKSALLLA